MDASEDVQELPGTPSTLLLVMVGFLCVTFVRDRATWAASVVTLVSLVGGGVKAVPRLAQALRSRQSTMAATGRSMRMKGEDRLTGVGTTELRYVGLLRRLATETANGVGAQMHAQGTAAGAVYNRSAAVFFEGEALAAGVSAAGQAPVAMRPGRTEGDTFAISELGGAFRARPPPEVAHAQISCFVG